jgi:hypothetical protein
MLRLMPLQDSNFSEEGLLLLSSIIDEVNKRGCQLNSINLSGALLSPTSITLILPPPPSCVRLALTDPRHYPPTFISNCHGVHAAAAAAVPSVFVQHQAR